MLCLVSYTISNCLRHTRHRALGFWFIGWFGWLAGWLKDWWVDVQKSIKNQSKMDQKSTKIHQKCIKNRWKLDPEAILGGSGGGLEAMLAPRANKTTKRAPTDPQRTPNGPPKLEPKSIQIEKKSIKNPFKNSLIFWSLFLSILDRFFIDFGRVLGPKINDFGLQSRLQEDM